MSVIYFSGTWKELAVDQDAFNDSLEHEELRALEILSSEEQAEFLDSEFIEEEYDNHNIISKLNCWEYHGECLCQSFGIICNGWCFREREAST